MSMIPEGLSELLSSNSKVLISFLGGIQGFILAVIVWFYPKTFQTSNRLLSAYIFFQAYLLVAIRFAEWLPAEYAWTVYSVRLTVFVFLYLYIKSLYTQIQWKKEWYHIPLIIIDIIHIRALVLFKIPLVLETGINFYQFYGSSLEIYSMVWLLFTMIFYFILNKHTLHKYRKKAEKNFSEIDAVGLKWAHQIFLGTFMLEVVNYLTFYLILDNFKWYIPYHGILNALLCTLFLYFITVKGKLNPKIYQLQQAADIEEETERAFIIESRMPYEGISETLQMIAEKVETVMLGDKLYLIEGLTVKEVAERIKEQPYLVSQAINNCLGKSFFDLVNGLRVEEAKRLIVDNNYSYLSMVGIGFESGFSSKTAFNTAFKKHTGMSPSEFKLKEMELKI